VTITNPNRPKHALTVRLSTETEKSQEEDLEMTPGDTVVVSKAGIVYVMGDVRLPTGVVMEHDGLTVLQAIAMAQGTNSTAALSDAKLIRKTAEGPAEVPFSLKKMLTGKAPDLKLQPDDIVFVPKSGGRAAATRGLEAVIQTATGIAIWGRF
jgi:polysaccharide export outer membrane protein